MSGELWLVLYVDSEGLSERGVELCFLKRI